MEHEETDALSTPEGLHLIQDELETVEDDLLTEEVASSLDGCTISTASDINPLPPPINIYWATINIVLLVLVFIISTLLIALVWHLAPRLPDGESIKIPTSLAQLRHLADVFHKYKDDHFAYSLLIFCSAYIWKQTYAIPGSILLNLVAGALFGMWIGTGLISILTAIGSSCCYLLSSLFARPLVYKLLWRQTMMIKGKIVANRRHVILFLLSARIFPFTPHWLLNISFPFVGIPIYLHFFTMILGMLPYHFICVRAGRILSEIKSVSDIFNAATLAQLITIAVIFVAVGIISKRLKREPRLPHLVTD
ncbi:unnamed protein product [Auanema sp. JU1783]|nr:unnamed protein product [Auanema sp. JU1783]